MKWRNCISTRWQSPKKFWFALMRTEMSKKSSLKTLRTWHFTSKCGKLWSSWRTKTQSRWLSFYRGDFQRFHNKGIRLTSTNWTGSAGHLGLSPGAWATMTRTSSSAMLSKSFSTCVKVLPQRTAKLRLQQISCTSSVNSLPSWSTTGHSWRLFSTNYMSLCTRHIQEYRTWLLKLI